MKLINRLVLALVAVGSIALSAAHSAQAEPAANGLGFMAVPGVVAGTSPDGLGTWSVHYQRINGGDPEVAKAINDGIDAEAMRQVQTMTWDGSTKRPWTFNATGIASVRPITVSELFVGEYNVAEPNMPIDYLASVVFDSRSGIRITWDNLFRDKQAGLVRLSEQTAAILPTVRPPAYPTEWQHSGQLAPVDINFKYWIPTAEGIELHFAEYQFGRGLKVITVPWANVEDLIAPPFVPIMH